MPNCVAWFDLPPAINDRFHELRFWIFSAEFFCRQQCDSVVLLGHDPQNQRHLALTTRGQVAGGFKGSRCILDCPLGENLRDQGIPVLIVREIGDRLQGGLWTLF